MLPPLSNHPTPYPEVNFVLQELLSGVQAVLGERFVGLYLYGSLSSGGFDPRRSDIDFVVATTGELPEAQVQGLEKLHEQLWATGLKWAAKLEGSYVPQGLLRRHDPASPPCPSVNEGKFYLVPLGADWIIQRHILRESGVVVVGPGLRELVDPVSPDELRGAVGGVLREWWLPMLGRPDWLRRPDYQAFAVLTMCRALHTLHSGAIASKPESARWAQEMLGERWPGLIQQSLFWPDGPQPERVAETLDLIRFTLDHVAE